MIKPNKICNNLYINNFLNIVKLKDCKLNKKGGLVIFILATLTLLLLVFLFFYFNFWSLIRYYLFPSTIDQSQRPKQQSITLDSKKIEQDIFVLSNNLQVPWEIVFISNEHALVTERPGFVKKVNLSNGDSQVIHTFSDLQPKGEGGLLGMALHPNFEQNNYIYFYLTVNTNGEISNKIERYQLINDQLVKGQIVLQGIEGAVYHDGGRVAFGPDGYLYITTGDATVPNYSQQTGNLMGKILRVTDTGEVVADNPFGNEVYSYGHRNPQGLAWDSLGRLWSTEHGPSVTDQGNDELNLIEKGKNYGWPVITGTQTADLMVTSVLESTDFDTWAPADLLYYTHNIDGGDKSALFFTGLRGEAIYKVVYENNKVVEFNEYFTGEWGRLRTLRLGPDGYFYLLTSNTDGRGKVLEGDDKIIKINPDLFF